MEAAPLQFLKDLLAAPSPSGFEQPIQQVVREYAASFADDVATDVHGNVICCANPNASVRVMYAGHCDQIGMLVTYIDDDGFIYADTIGGWDPQQLIGQRMTIWAQDGPIPAVIARKPIHLLSSEERKQVVPLTELWLDIGAQSKEEVSNLIAIGDPITLELGFQEMRNGFANSPGMDDKTGLWIVIEAMRRAKQRGLSASLYSVSTVQEEIGLRGARTSAYGVDPHVAIAVDVTHATDCPTIDKRQRGEISLGQGPVVFRGPNINPIVGKQLLYIATENSIPTQQAAVGRATPNDANSLQINRAGVATGLIGTPNRYMHSAVETVSLADLDHAANLLAEFAIAVDDSSDFTPR